MWPACIMSNPRLLETDTTSPYFTGRISSSEDIASLTVYSGNAGLCFVR